MKIIAFFARNPDEELTVDDVEVKFGVGHAAAAKALQRLQKSDWLELIVDNDLRLYRVNPAVMQQLEP